VSPAPKKVAVIGGGMAGLTAGYYLTRRYEVTLFEKESRLGGNAYSLPVRSGEHLDIAVAAFGRAGYKDFYTLLSELGVETELCQDSYMSFHNLDTGKGLYLTLSAEGTRFQGLDMLRPANFESLARLFVGLRRAQYRLKRGGYRDHTLGQCLEGLPEFGGDAKVVFLSVLCLLSSMGARELLASPAEFFLNKLRVHHDVISPKAVYSVRCVRHGTRRYVNALAARFRRRVRFHARIKTVKRTRKGAVLVMDDGSREEFAKVVFACNPDQALALLASPTEDERKLLGAWRYKDGRVVVHRDHGAFPPRALIEAYTFLFRMEDGVFETSVNGALWKEPQVSESCDYISSQHPNFPIRKDLIELDTVLRTPVFDFESCATIPRLRTLNSGNVSFFCGSYFGYGLHEDAVSSAKAVAKRLRCV